MVSADLCHISNSDVYHHINLLDRCKHWTQTLSMRVELLRRPLGPGTFLLRMALAVVLLTAHSACADTPASKVERVTFVVFADQPVHEGEWNALFESLHSDLVRAATESPELGPDFELVRGDQLSPGFRVERTVSVYLHGSCTLLPFKRYVSAGPLGWVLRVHGQIEPFIHVNCSEITAMLEPFALGMNRDRSNTVMGESMARVILHEWIHVATQSTSHAQEGVSKAQFGVADLLADDAEIRHDPRFPRSARPGL
jgi:hypothetical protein